jgi:anti-sigma factor RsiW
MTRAEMEALICEYVEGTLEPRQRAEVERYLEAHPAEAEAVREALLARQVLEQAPPVEVPGELLTRILFEIRSQTAPVERGQDGFWARLIRTLGPVLQPRIAMGMAMTILSFSMLGHLAGLRFQQITAADLKPAALYAVVENQVIRIWERAVKYYEDLKFVYQIQSLVREWSEMETPEPAAGPSSQGGEGQPAEAGSQPPSAGRPESQ